MSVLDMISSSDGTPEQYVQFKCPGCSNIHCIGVGPKASGPRWGWNGDKAKPTFTPSVLAKGNKLTFNEHGNWDGGWERDGQGNLIPYVCHSFVTEGRIQFLSDCTHALAGQTVDLPDFDQDES
ncbi:DUF6527 family protein [Polaromonas sp.]|uniref:DUF6527 family protein n=1 Tax=Polaromonas sp. TaxID=1869339 RepID=UPI003BB6AB2E